MLSILIPTYNENITDLVYELNKQCLECRINFEILCQDDFSTAFLNENSAINAIENCFYFKTDKNIGRTATRNLLAQKAKYSWILFLDADVEPTDNHFIKNYIAFIDNNNYQLVLGGYQYANELPEPYKMLRYKYGKNFEEKKATVRNKNPYQYVFSGNMLIQKELFLLSNYNSEGNYYGMDTYFAYQLFINKVKIKHIDNPIYHLGLDENTVFFEKAMDAVKTRKSLLLNLRNIDEISPILKLYKDIDRYHLRSVTAMFFRLSKPYLKRRIINKNPSLFCFNLYRLGYICSIK